MADWGFWLAAGGLSLAVAATLIRAIVMASSRAAAGRVENAGTAEYDLAVYRDQLAEVDRDVARGTLAPEEGQRLRTEVSRRLLDADRVARAEGASARPKGGWALAGLVVAVLAGSIAVYARLGAPGYPDLPLKERFALSEDMRAARMSQVEAEAQTPPMPEREGVDPAFLELMAQLRKTVAERPEDLRGLELLARNEAALGNFKAAQDAQRRLIGQKGPAASAEDRALLAELMILSAGGFVSPEAEEELVRALSVDPRNGLARFYSGVMFAQVGRYDRTFVLWRALLDEGPADAAWIAPIRAQIMDVAARAGVNYEPPAAQPGPSAEDVATASEMAPEDRQAMIEGMVAQLGARLATEGGTAEEWARLISSLAVLGRTDEAREIYAEALVVFEGKTVETQGIREAAVRAGIAE